MMVLLVCCQYEIVRTSGQFPTHNQFLELTHDELTPYKTLLPVTLENLLISPPTRRMLIGFRNSGLAITQDCAFTPSVCTM